MDNLKEIPGFNGFYSASIEGQIYSHLSHKYLVKNIVRQYYTVGLKLKNGLSIRCNVSRLVAATYLGLDRNDRTIDVDHGILGKLNDSVKNLQLLSHHDNILKFYGRLNIDTSTHKLCSICKQLKLRHLFSHSRRYKDGLKSSCKACDLEKSKRYI